MCLDSNSVPWQVPATRCRRGQRPSWAALARRLMDVACKRSGRGWWSATPGHSGHVMTRFCGSSRKVRSHCWSLRVCRGCQKHETFQKHVLKLGQLVRPAARRRAIHLHPPSCQAGPSAARLPSILRGFRALTDQEELEGFPVKPEQGTIDTDIHGGENSGIRGLKDSGLGRKYIYMAKPSQSLGFTFGKLRSVKTFATALTESPEIAVLAEMRRHECSHPCCGEDLGVSRHGSRGVFQGTKG